MPTGALTIRPACPADLGAVAEIAAHYVTTSTATFELAPVDRHGWDRRFRTIAAQGLPFLVAALSGEIAGYAYCTAWKPRPAYRRTVEDSVYVAPWAGGCGVGGALLDALLASCEDAGVCEVIAVVVDTGDPASLKLHRTRQFADVGRLTGVGFKHGQWLDTVLLQRSLRRPADASRAGR
ncbi:MAG: GNAT family N-acetyltransferase [Nitriliruptorales bacterium]|nr:GNAT family N-acetyltransferase [Nitriliruptorales bacterium]